MDRVHFVFHPVSRANIFSQNNKQNERQFTKKRKEVSEIVSEILSRFSSHKQNRKQLRSNLEDGSTEKKKKKKNESGPKQLCLAEQPSHTKTCSTSTGILKSLGKGRHF